MNTENSGGSRGKVSQIEFDPEDDESNEPYLLDDPFDPNQIDISVEIQNVGYLLALLEDNLVDLNSDFQRSPDLWPPSKMSRFIESLIVRLPIPPFYLATPETIPATQSNQIQIVDGLQRLSTLHRFAINKTEKKLRLTDLELLPELKGKTFDDLDRSVQRAIERAQVTLYLIRPNTPKPVKYIIFNRMNTGGLTLNGQEIRHALNPGSAAKFLDELVSLPSFRQHIKNRHPRMRDQELALRFLAFRLTGPENYRRGVKKFLDDAMEEIGRLTRSELNILKDNYDSALETSYAIFGKFAFSRSSTKKPILNKALYDTWTINLSYLSDQELYDLIKKSSALKRDYEPLLSKYTAFFKSISQDTSSPDSVATRFSGIRNLITGVLYSSEND